MLQPLLTLSEVEAWLGDGNQSVRGNRDDWLGLLDDLATSWGEVGPNTLSALDEVSVSQLLSESAALQAAVRGRQHGVPRQEASQLNRAATRLRGTLERPAVLPAAFDDATAAAQTWPYPTEAPRARDDIEWQLAFLASVGELQRHDWAVLASRLKQALNLDREPSGETRVDVARKGLQTPPATGHSVVWMAFDHASAWGVRELEPTVMFFEADWLLPNLEQWEESRRLHDSIPTEIALHRDSVLSSLHRLEPEMPVVFARVDLDVGPVAGARDRARDTLRLLRDHAAFEQGGSHWRLNNIAFHFVDGELVFSSAGAIGDPDAYDRVTRYGVIHSDRTGAILNQDAPILRPHLPVSDAEVHEALEMASWLTSARANPSPGRLVLAQRILEQVAKWASRKPWDLIRQDLLWPWIWAQIDDELSAVGVEAVLRMPGATGPADSEERQRFLELNRAVISSEGDRPRADPLAVLERLDDLLAAHSAGSETLPYLQELSQRLATGTSALAWIDELTQTFERLRTRAKRTRNAVVHGGPLIKGVADSVSGFQDRLARQALRLALEARLANDDVGHYIDDRTARYHVARRQLEQGASVSEALASAR